MKGEEVCDAQVEYVDLAIEHELEAPEERLLSLMASLGHNQEPSTIKILWCAKKQKLIILFDSGSTHNFVDPLVIKIVEAHAETMGRS